MTKPLITKQSDQEFLNLVSTYNQYEIEIKNLHGLADRPLEMRLCASGHVNKMFPTVTKKEQNETTAL